MRARTVAVLAIGILMFGCGDANGGDDGTTGGDDGPMEGQVRGESWEAVGGNAVPNPDDDSEYIINIVDREIDLCDHEPNSGLYVRTSIEPEEGEQSTDIYLGEFGEFGESHLTNTIDIHEWGENVSGYLDHSFQDDYVEGTFSVPVCDQ